MSGVNKVILIGRLGKDPEIKNFDNGGMLANFTMATSETYKDRTTGEKKEITDWHNISVRIPQQAQIIQKYVHKGDMLYVEGKMRTRSWEKDGKTNYITEVLVDSFTMLSSKPGNGQQSNGQGNNHSQDQGYGQAPAQNNYAANQMAPAGDTGGGSDDLPF